MTYVALRRKAIALREAVRNDIALVSRRVMGKMGVMTKDDAFDSARRLERLRTLEAGIQWYLGIASAEYPVR